MIVKAPPGEAALFVFDTVPITRSAS